MPKHPAQEAWGQGDIPTGTASGPEIANATETYMPFVALSVSDITTRNLERTKHVVLLEGDSIKFFKHDPANTDPEDGDTVIWDSEDRPFVLVHRGAKGDPLWNPRGSYSGGTTYSRGDLVEDQEHSWIYINDTAGAGNAPPTYPTLSNSYWQWVAGRGPQGDQGDMLEHDAFPGLPHKPAFYEDWAVNQFLRQNYSITRASTGTRLNKAGLLETVAVGEPRFHTFYESGETGLLVEGARTNLLLRSEEFDNAIWAKSEASVTVSANATTAPDGNASADKVVETTTTGGHIIRQSLTLANSTTYISSVFAKAGERSVFTMLCLEVGSGNYRSVDFNLGAGTATARMTNLAGTQGMEPLANGWVRCWVTFTTVNAGAGSYVDYRLSSVASPSGNAGDNYTGDGSSGMYFWGAHLEAGSAPSSYIATAGSQVTRAADTVTRSNDDGVLNVAEGTLFAEVVVQHKFAGNIPNRYLASIDDGTLTERISLMYYQTGNGVVGYVHDGGHVEAQLNLTPVNAGDVWRVAIAYASNDVAGSVNGGAVQTDSSVVLPATTQFTIGNVATGPHLFGIVKRVAYWPRRLTNQQIQAITSRTGYFFDVTDNVLRPVSVGADDSGGSGYKVLRIAN